MSRITDFDAFLDAFENGDDVLQYAADGKSHVTGTDWFVYKLTENAAPMTVVELPTPAYKVAYEKAAENNLTVSQFLSKLLTGKVAVL